MSYKKCTSEDAKNVFSEGHKSQKLLFASKQAEFLEKYEDVVVLVREKKKDAVQESDVLMLFILSRCKKGKAQTVISQQLVRLFQDQMFANMSSSKLLSFFRQFRENVLILLSTLESERRLGSQPFCCTQICTYYNLRCLTIQSCFSLCNQLRIFNCY